MRYAYFLVGAAIVLAGVYFIVDDLRGDSFFRGLGVTAGLAVVYLGVLNLLNYVYGLTARGIRGTALGVNITMLAFALWIAWPPSVGFEWVLFVLVFAGACLSVTPRALGPSLPRIRTNRSG
jgi:hypothetical protein